MGRSQRREARLLDFVVVCHENYRIFRVSIAVPMYYLWCNMDSGAY